MPIVDQTLNFYAFFDIDNICYNFNIRLFGINNFVNNLKSADLSAFDNFSPIYRWPLIMAVICYRVGSGDAYASKINHQN